MTVRIVSNLHPEKREYSGQTLGVRMPSGEIDEIPQAKVYMVVAGNRILEKAPLSGLPIVILS